MGAKPTFAAAEKPVVEAVNNTNGLPPPAKMIDVTIDQIHVWSGQPRHVRNARYDSLKESIRNMGGLERPIDLTEEPGVEGYVTRKGGGTRLEILHELWAETGDRRFYQLTLPLYEYPGVVAMRVSHNIENLERGEQTYGDTARSIVQLCEDLQSETGDFESLTLRAKADVITQQGLPIRNNRLMLYLYTVDRLLDHLPKAFASGLGRPRVEAIRKVEKNFRDLVERNALDRVEDWDVAFLQSLNEADSDSFDIAALERTLSLRLKNEFDIRIGEAPARSDDLLSDSDNDSSSNAQRASDARGNEQDTHSQGVGNNVSNPPTKTSRDPSGNPATHPAPSGSRMGEGDLAADPAPSGSRMGDLLTPSEIRDQASLLAVELATEYGMVGGALFTMTDPPIGLSYGVLSPDYVRLQERDNWKDCLLVHSVMHCCMWASILIDIELGFLQRTVLQELYDSSPEAIGKADAWDLPRSTEVVVHRQHMQCRIEAGLATEQEASLIRKIHSMEHLAAIYAASMRLERDTKQGNADG